MKSMLSWGATIV